MIISIVIDSIVQRALPHASFAKTNEEGLHAHRLLVLYVTDNDTLMILMTFLISMLRRYRCQRDLIG